MKFDFNAKSNTEFKTRQVPLVAYTLKMRHVEFSNAQTCLSNVGCRPTYN